MKDRLRVLVAGCGSIGRRHIRNLIASGVRDLVLCDTSTEALRKAGEGVPGAVFTTNFEEALKTGPDAAVVCTPSSMHLGMSERLVRDGVHVLIEKPLSDSLTGVKEFLGLVESKGVVAMMAMCYRFHPVFQKVKALLDRGTVGRIYHVNYFGGHYLPDWHPGADYRTEYAAKKSLGGGAVLTSIHGLDNIRWLFGEVRGLHSYTDRVSGLDMDVEDLAVALFRMEDGSYVSWETDFLNRARIHRAVITGEKGTIMCDFVAGILGVYLAEAGEWKREDIRFDINSMYVSEIEHFLSCVQKGGRPIVDAAEGFKTLGLALSVKEGYVGTETVRKTEGEGQWAVA